MLHAPTVLLFDEDPVLRTATALLLSNRGAAMHPAATLEEAIALARECTYDAAVIDLAATAPSGAAVLTPLLDEGLVARRIVLCVTELRQGDATKGVSELILKPYAFDRLLDAVLGQRGQRRPTRSGTFAQARPARALRRNVRARLAPN